MLQGFGDRDDDGSYYFMSWLIIDLDLYYIFYWIREKYKMVL